MIKNIVEPFAILAPMIYLLLAVTFDIPIVGFRFWAFATLCTELLIYALIIVEDKYDPK